MGAKDGEMGAKDGEMDPLDALRPLMAAHNPPIDVLIVPSADYHQSEYVADRDKRRAFVSGFTGSAGVAVITANEALLWTDGRYFLQAIQQLSERWKLMRIGEDPAVENWIADNLPNEAIVGVDPWCISVDTAQRWERIFSKRNQKIYQLSSNLVDQIWKNRPLPKIQPVIVQSLEFAGCPVAEKLKDLREKLTQEKASGMVIVTLDEVAWLYNIRGNDVSYCPVVHAFAIVTLDSAFLYVDMQKITPEVATHLANNGIEVRDYLVVEKDAEVLATGALKSSVAVKDSQTEHIEKGEETTACNNHNETKKEKGNLVWMDPVSGCFALYSKLPSDQVLLQPSPLALAKSLKNPVELDGLRKAHVRDGAAVVQYLVWLDKQMQEIYGASGYFSESGGTNKGKHSETTKLTEVSVSDKLESFRAQKELFRGLSFPTISSVGPNAAIIHYSPDRETCADLDANSIYLFDSGAQYLDGTTDITRTVHFGKPSIHEKACYTAVLKGHIALDAAVFPSGTTGYSLDTLARVPLWKDGLDYRHGTGHGIGSYLNVHEGPQLISFKPQSRSVPLQASMTVTDEPGYYEDGNFGIRLENVLIVKEAKTKFNFGDKCYLAFENITWAPYQAKLMNVTLLSPEELEWVNTYHSKCREVLAPFLNEQEMAWLKKATEPLRA